jgi:uncharacterized coiled-coil protein SlyX
MKNVLLASIISIGLLFSGLSMGSTEATSKKKLEEKVEEQELRIQHLEEKMKNTEETINELNSVTQNLSEKSDYLQDEISYLQNRNQYLEHQIQQLFGTVCSEFTTFEDIPTNELSSYLTNHIISINQQEQKNCAYLTNCQKETVEIKVIFKSNSFNYEELISAEEVVEIIQNVLDENLNSLDYINIKNVQVKMQHHDSFLYEFTVGR